MNTNTELLLLLLAIFGGIEMAGKGARLLIFLVPRLLSVRSRLWCLVADTFTIQTFRRKAIATGLEEILNQTAFKLQRHLPKGWIKRARIRWVRNSQAALLREGQLVLRVRPGKSADCNFIQSLHTYFYAALFPGCKDILPDVVISATSLAITRASLEGTHRYLLEEFDNVFLNTFGEAHQDVLDQFGDYVRLNEYGFLMGPFLREVNHAVNEARFTANRAHIPEMIRRILDHMLAFQAHTPLPEDAWFYNGPCTSYGFSLVSKPPNSRPAIEAYVRRAQSMVEKGIKRLYVIGRYDERDFVFKVIEALPRIRELKVLEIFTLFRDYRGDENGVGALLGLDEMLAGLRLTLRPLNGVQQQAFASTPSNALEAAANEPQELEIDGAARLDLTEIAEDLIIQLSDYEGAWISLAEFGNRLRTQVPGFTPQSYGGRNLISVLKGLNSLEFDERGAGPAKSVYVRLRAGANKLAEHRSTPTEGETFEKIMEIIRENSNYDGWIFLGRLGHLIRVKFQDFHYDDFGALSLREFIHRIPELKLEERGEGHSKTYVRIK